MLNWAEKDYRKERREGLKALEALIEKYNSSGEEFTTIEEVQQGCFRCMCDLSDLPHLSVYFQFEEYRIYATVFSFDWSKPDRVYEGCLTVDVVQYEDNNKYCLECKWRKHSH